MKFIYFKYNLSLHFYQFRPVKLAKIAIFYGINDKMEFRNFNSNSVNIQIKATKQYFPDDSVATFQTSLNCADFSDVVGQGKRYSRSHVK